MECKDCQNEYPISLKFCSTCDTPLSKIPDKQNSKLLIEAIQAIKLDNVILFNDNIPKGKIEPIQAIAAKKSCVMRTMIIHSSNTNGKIQPIIGGKYVETIILTICGVSTRLIDLSYYANLRNVFINLLNVRDKETIMASLKALYGEESEIIGLTTELSVNKKGDCMEIHNRCSACQIKPSLKMRYGCEIVAEESTLLVKFHQVDTNVWIINQLQYDDIIRKI